MAERTQEEIQAELDSSDEPVRGAGGDQVIDDSGGGDGDAGGKAAAELEAGKKGWVPKDKFKGPPEKWKPASQFLADGDKFQKSTQRELLELRQKVADFEGTKTQFAKFYEELLANKQKELDGAISELRI